MHAFKMDCEVKYYKLLDLKHFKSLVIVITDLPNHSNHHNSKNILKKILFIANSH